MTNIASIETLNLKDPANGIEFTARVLEKVHVPFTGENIDKLRVEIIETGETRRMVSKFPSWYIRPLFIAGGGKAEEYYNTWRRLNRENFPVTPEMYMASHQQVVMPDVTEQGGVFYDKQYANTNGVTKPTDDIFLQLNRGTVQDAACAILDKATGLRLALNADDPLSLLVNPDGTFKLYTLDLNGIGTTRLAEISNRMCLEQFMRTYDRAKRTVEEARLRAEFNRKWGIIPIEPEDNSPPSLGSIHRD